MRIIGGLLALALVVGAGAEAEARAGKARSLGFIGRANAAPAVTAAPRSPGRINVIVSPRAGRGQATAAAVLPASGFCLMADAAEAEGLPIAGVQKSARAYPTCPSDQLFGSGVGFCEIN
jgi:hypothetical protein